MYFSSLETPDKTQSQYHTIHVDISRESRVAYYTRFLCCCRCCRFYIAPLVAWSLIDFTGQLLSRHFLVSLHLNANSLRCGSRTRIGGQRAMRRRPRRSSSPPSPCVRRSVVVVVPRPCPSRTWPRGRRNRALPCTRGSN